MYLALIIVVPVAVLAWLFWAWVWKKGRLARIGLLAFAGFVGYQTYFAIFPPRSFYAAEFSEWTGLVMPRSAKVLFSKASYPDFHGDYASEVLFEVTQEDYSWLNKSMVKATNPQGLGGMYWREAEAAYGRAFEASYFGSIRSRKMDQHGGWALLSDGKTVYFWFVQT